MDLFDLVATITLDSSGFESGLSEASNAASGFGSKMGGALKTAGKIGAAGILAVGSAAVNVGKKLWNGAKEVAEYGDHIDKMSQKMGISAQAYQEWDAVMQHSGTSIDSMQRGMMTLSKAAASNSEAFEKLGITEEELATMNQEELFAKTIEGLQGMEEGSDRAALAQELLGGAAKELGPLLNTTAEETQAMKDRVHELGGVMSDEAVKAAAEFQDNLQDLQTAISGVKRGITEEFLPAANDMLAGFTMLIAGEDGAEEKLDQGIEKLTTASSNAIDRVTSISEKLFPRIAEMISKIGPKVIELGASIVVSLAEGFIRNLPTYVTSLVDAVVKIVDTIATDIAPMLPEVAVDLITSLAETLIDNLDKIIDAALKIALGLVQGLLKAIPKLVDKVPTIISKLVTALIKAIPQIIKAGVELFVSLVKNIPAIISGIVKAIPEIIEGILGAFGDLAPELGAIFEGAFDIITDIFSGLGDFFAGIWEVIYDIFSVVGEVLGGFFSAAWDMIKAAWEGVSEFFSKIWDGIKKVFEKVGDWFKGIFENAWKLIKGAWDAVIGFFQGIWDGIVLIFEGVGSWFEGVFKSAVDLIEGVWDGITGFFQGIWDGIMLVFEPVVSFFEGIFGGARNKIREMFDDMVTDANRAAGDIGNAVSKIAASAVAGRVAGGSANKSVSVNASGSVLRRGEIALLEGTGAEAVVPLDQNRKWIRAVASEFNSQAMAAAGGGGAGDIVIPVYIGNSFMEEIVVRSDQITNYRSGGRA